MKKLIVLFLTAMAFIGGLQAKPVDVETAKALGVKFMNANTSVKSVEAELAYTAAAIFFLSVSILFYLIPVLHNFR